MPANARPTVEVGGQPQAGLSGNLLRFNSIETANGVHRCEAVFNNWGLVSIGRSASPGFLYFDRSLLDFGKRVVIKFSSGIVIDGVITAISANYPGNTPPELSIIVDDRYRDLRLVTRTRTFDNVTDSDIARKIANDHGLTLTVDLRGPIYKSVAQLNQSDLAFLRTRARLCDAELRLQGQQLYVKSRANSGSEALSLAFGQSLTSFSVTADTASQPTKVTATAWDVANKAAANVTVTDSILGSQLRGGTSGAKVVTLAFGERAVNAPLSPLDPHVLAESAFRTEAQRFLVGHGSALGDARVAVGAMIRLTGLGTLFTGLYYVSEVNHSFDSQTGATTRFTVETPALGQTQ
jgi:phage protein D